MKKSLLLLAMAITSSGVMAQTLTSKEVKVKRMPVDVMAMPAKSVSVETPGQKVARKAPRKSVTSGTYYARPEGAFYKGYDKEGYGSYYDAIVLAPYADTKFVNKSTAPAESLWHINFFNTSGEMSGQYDFTPYAESNGDLIWSQGTGYSYAAPTLINKLDSFTIGHVPYDEENYEGNEYWTTGVSIKDYGFIPGPYWFTRMVTDSLVSITNVDQHVGSQYSRGVLNSGQTYNGSAFNYLFGSGSYTSSSGTVMTASGFQQYIEKPISSLYVEDVHINGFSFGSKAVLSNSAQLTMLITDAVWNAEYEQWVQGDNLIATLTCTADDVTNTVTQWGYSSVQMVFSNKTTDAFGVEVNEPFVIDQPVLVTVVGFESGWDVDLPGIEQPDYDPVETSYMVYIANGNTYMGPFYNGSISVPVTFNGIYDYTEPRETAVSRDATTGETTATYEHFNVIKISADGKTIANYAAPEIPYTYIDAAFPWYDHEDNENYFIDNVPSWVNLAIQDDYETDEGTEYFSGVTLLGVASAEALPAGVTGRYANLYVEGRGYTSKTPIIILQGDATLEEALADGIENVTADKHANAYKGTFNLAGQKVGNAYKGIVIKNGRKYIQK